MRRKGLGAVAVGAVLLIAAVVGLIVVPEHHPTSRSELVTSEGQVVRECFSTGSQGGPYTYRGVPCHDATITSGPSQTLDDAVRIATWALAIFGACVVALGLIRYARPEVRR